MAVIYGKNNSGGGLLGGLGAIATLGGTLLGGPTGAFLSKLGMGAGLANSMMNGSFVSGGEASGGNLLDLMKEILGDEYTNPASGNMVQYPTKSDNELYNQWSPYDPYAGRRYF